LKMERIWLAPEKRRTKNDSARGKKSKNDSYWPLPFEGVLSAVLRMRGKRKKKDREERTRSKTPVGKCFPISKGRHLLHSRSLSTKEWDSGVEKM